MEARTEMLEAMSFHWSKYGWNSIGQEEDGFLQSLKSSIEADFGGFLVTIGERTYYTL